MIKIRIESDEENVFKSEGDYAFGCLCEGDECRSFLVGQTNPVDLIQRMADSCVNLILGAFEAEKGTFAGDLAIEVFMAAVKHELEDDSTDVKTLRKVREIFRNGEDEE